MKKLLLTVALGITVASWSQAKTISGLVKDKKTGDPMIGAVIQVKDNKSLATTTGLDGTFALKDLPETGRVTLVVTYMSYKTKEVTVDLGKAENLNVNLEEDAKQLGEVVVHGVRNNRTDRSAITMEKNAGQVLNVMSQQALQLSPDVNVASALQRVSGVTMERDASGEASYAILRGMDKRYNYTLVNGIKIPSPDDKNRYIPLNLFPSDLMDRLIVSKSLTPDMEGDAAGGVVDMNMKDAPGQFMLQANGAIGASDYFWSDSHDYLSADRGNTTSKAPYEKYGSTYDATVDDFKNGGSKIKNHSMPMPNFIGGITVGNRFWNHRLGVLVAASLQNTYRGSERTLNKPVMANGETTEYISSMKKRWYSIHDLNLGVHAKIDLSLGNHKFEWYNMLVERKEDNVRYNQSITTDYGYDPDNGTYTRDDELRSLTQTQDIFASHLKGTHHLTDRLTVDWSGLFADAREKDPDRVYVGIKNNFENGSLAKTVANNMERRFQHNDDKDWTGMLNITYDTPFKGFDALWKVGGMYRNKKRNNRFYSYLFNPASNDALASNDYDQYENISWYCRTPRAQASQLNYDSKEHIGAAYAMVTLSNSWGDLIAGFRAEHTNQIYTMLQKFENLGPVGEQSYWDWLPSVALKWKMNKQMNLRLSYYKSINRPGFYELVPYQIEGEEYTEKGNPNLKRSRIDNMDLRWEWFPSATEQILAGVFYKYLKDPIETTFVSDQRQTNNNYYMPQNLGNAKNFGFEIDVIKYIRHFGVKANYTYTHSAITTNKLQYTAKNVIVNVNQTRPLVNQAPHTANLSLLYKDTENGWNGQLAASYTGTRLVLVSPFKDADEWERGMVTLDLSGEKKFKNGISIFVKANNLLNNKRERYLKTVNDFDLSLPGQRSDRTVTSTYKFGRTFLIGIRYKL
ncbi:TonB-dependent receptor [Prevotella sp. AGR2160]|uniref:TonB-dependent receptor n=1 Tax=Prevotella sp. AGR2160 TaxID=1280674 RepID=UPI00048D039D|nr:TonB-dependent receptor [Prevotella sp. AGR2160]